MTTLLIIEYALILVKFSSSLEVAPTHKSFANKLLPPVKISPPSNSKRQTAPCLVRFLWDDEDVLHGTTHFTRKNLAGITLTNAD